MCSQSVEFEHVREGYWTWAGHGGSLHCSIIGVRIPKCVTMCGLAIMDPSGGVTYSASFWVLWGKLSRKLGCELFSFAHPGHDELLCKDSLRSS